MTKEEEFEAIVAERSKTTKWVVAGVIGTALIGGVAWAMSSKKPTVVDWYGYQIRIEDRELDEETTGGKPYRWVLAKDETMVATGLSESTEIALDAAKSAIDFGAA